MSWERKLFSPYIQEIPFQGRILKNILAGMFVFEKEKKPLWSTKNGKMTTLLPTKDGVKDRNWQGNKCSMVKENSASAFPVVAGTFLEIIREVIEKGGC